MPRNPNEDHPKAPAMANPPPESPPKEVNPLEWDDDILGHEPKSDKAIKKVALDLDDAPFLDDIEEEAPPEEDKPEAPDAEQAVEEPKPEKSSRGILIIIGAVAALLLAGLAFWLTRPPPPEPEAPEPLHHPEPAPKPKPEEYSLDLNPFWVAYTQGEDVAFLTLRLALVMEGSTSYVEVQRKELILRDAVYYFLNNRPIPEIKHKDAADTLKTNLMSVMNQHLGSPLTDVLIKEYMVR